MSRRGRQPDPVKEQFWRDAIQCWERSGLSIRAFCAEQALSEFSFHAWRRTIARRDQPASSPVPERRDPVPAFVPVRVTGAPLALATPSLEVVLGSGRTVRVSPGFDPATLRHLLAVLEEGSSC
jgi:transposase